MASGEVHFGITGEDFDPRNRSVIDCGNCAVATLGLGFADVVVRCRGAWIDVAAWRTRRCLHRIPRPPSPPPACRDQILGLTRNFFAAHGMPITSIVESLGATEGAPRPASPKRSWTSTTTGATLAANDLKVLDDGVILKSQAQLAAIIEGEWGRAPLAAAGALDARIAARELARNSYLLRAAIGSRSEVCARGTDEIGCSVLSQSARKAGSM